MNILITGAKGQLGSEIAKILLAHHSELGEVSDAYLNANVTCVDIDELDISNIDDVDIFFKVSRFDVVFNCAAMTNVDGCEGNPMLAMKVNAIGARNIAMATAKQGGKLVHVSTDYVFAGDGDISHSEWDACIPKTVYGKSKLLGEQYVSEQCSQHFIVRTAWLYSAVGKNFVKTIISAAKKNGKLKVVNDQIGNPTNVADLAYHLLKLAVTGQYGVYHCTGAGECSWYDFACKIVELADIPCETMPCTTEEFANQTPRPQYSALDNLMLRCTVGDEMRNWEKALEEFFQIQYESGNDK